MNVEVFSFFSGLGLLDLGFENTGFNIVFVNEYNKRFLNAYQYARRNNEHIPSYGYSDKDIREYLIDDIWYHSFPAYDKREEKIIGFIGGPPCPDFSIAGKNDGKNGINGQLTLTYADLIIKRKPDFFVFENVKGLYQTKKHREFYDAIKRRFRRAGYTLFDSIENALEYGVPQYRDRLFLIGFSTKVFGKKLKCNIGAHKKYHIDRIMAMPWPTLSPFVADSKLDCPDGIIKDLTVEFWFNKNNVEFHPNGKDSVYKKVLVLSAASYFESKISELISKYATKASGSDKRIVNLIESKVIERQYHTLFDWKANNTNTFWKLFGESTKDSVRQHIDGDEDMKVAERSFIDLGRQRNLLVHENFAEFDVNITVEEIYNKYRKACKFISLIETVLDPAYLKK